MGQFDDFTSGEARRVFQEGERRKAEMFLRQFWPPPGVPSPRSQHRHLQGLAGRS